MHSSPDYSLHCTSSHWFMMILNTLTTRVSTSDFLAIRVSDNSQCYTVAFKATQCGDSVAQNEKQTKLYTSKYIQIHTVLLRQNHAYIIYASLMKIKRKYILILQPKLSSQN